MLRNLIVSLFLVSIAGCPDESKTEPTSDAAPHTHSLQSALQTPYDKASSKLGADNVQDALDELAERPLAEAPLGMRLYWHTVSFTDTKESVELKATCPISDKDVVIGGACLPPIAKATLLGSDFGPNGSYFKCSYRQEVGSPVSEFGIDIVCLKDAK
jgi:hypothetical protein